jgi:PKD repeat protein
MNPVPNVTITPAALAICTGQSMNLTAGGANTYTWSPSNGLNQTTGTTVTTSATINTTYTVTGTDINGCVSTQDISVVVLQLPNLTLTEQDQWICNGSSTQLFASGAQSYAWSPFSSLNASQGSAVIASPNVTTTYTVTGTDANGCQDSDTISVTVHPPPITFNVQPQLCQWETVNLIANGANEYTWTPSFGLNTSTGASVLATPTLTTTYTVVGTDIYGCTGSNAVIVTVHFPTITINPDSAEICNGQSQVFSASGAVQYAWYPSNGLNVTTSAIVSASPSTTTTYTLIGTDIYGCPDTVLVPLIVHPQPEALFTYTPPEGCDSLLVTFTNLSTDADIFLWTFSDGTNSTELNPAHWFSGPGNYDVTLYVEGTGGCNDSETITDAITVWPMPVAEFAWRQSNYPVINGEVFFDNNSLNADTYNWNFGDSTYSTAVNPSHQYQQYGTYFVTLIATNDFDCKDTIVKPISVKFYKGLYLPNAMTPEYGDPATRVFTPKGFNLKSYRIQIYDTWGNMLWESTKLTERGEPAESWDGYYNGQLLQQDVYVWKVEATFLDDTVWEGMHYPSGEIKPTGTVTILR